MSDYLFIYLYVFGTFAGGNSSFLLYFKLWQSSDGHPGSSFQGNQAQTDKLVFHFRKQMSFVNTRNFQIYSLKNLSCFQFYRNVP